MSQSNPAERELVDRLERARHAANLSQRAIARDLGITQGHYSKIIAGKVNDRRHYAERALRILSGEASRGEEVDQLVIAASREIRNSVSFRRLVEAALGYARRDVT